MPLLVFRDINTVGMKHLELHNLTMESNRRVSSSLKKTTASQI